MSKQTGKCFGYLCIRHSLFLFLFPDHACRNTCFLRCRKFFLKSAVRTAGFCNQIADRKLMDHCQIHFLRKRALHRKNLLSADTRLFTETDTLQSGKHTHKQTLLQGCKYRQLFASGCQKNVSGCVRKCLDTAFIIGKHMHGSSALFHAFVFRYATDSIVHSPLEPQIWNSTSFCTLPDVGRHFCGKRMRSIHDCRIVVLSVFFQQGAHFLYVQSSYTDLHTGKFRHDHLTVFGCYMHITGNMCP